MRAKTRLIHGGVSGDPLTGAVSVPIYQTSTYKQDGVGNHRGYEYSRTGNPTRAALENLAAELEGGWAGFAFSSGMAAITSVLSLFSQGDHLIFTDDLYGGTYRLATKILHRFGLETDFVDTTRVEETEKAIRPNTRAIFVETPTNPLLKITDLQEISRLAQAHSLLLIVDNTFQTPYWQNPMELGADIVLHSATKYLGGHSDVVAGLAIVRTRELGEQLHFIQNAAGAILGPQDAWLLLRGMKTLGIRMEEHERNARQVANFLLEHPKVARVHYPGLPSHPHYELACRQARGFGAMISFDMGSEEKALHLMDSLRYFTLAESLGAVESLISLPSRMTHASVPVERREALGITPGLVRLSIGLEDIEDLLEDLEQGFKRLV